MTKTTTVASKAFVAIVAAAMVFSLVAPAAKAATAEELQAQIAALMAQITALSGGTTAAPAAGACVAITAPLTMGSTGANVTALQNALIKAGQSIPAGATGLFGAQTRAALAAYQTANGIAPAVGYYGPVTAAKMAAMCVPVTPAPGTGTGTTPTTPGSTTLKGEADLDEYTADDADDDSVQEGDEEVDVAMFTAKFADGDASISRLDVAFTNSSSTLGANVWDALDTVSLWVDGKMVAEADASSKDDYLGDEDLGIIRFSDLNIVAMEDEDTEITVKATIQDGLDTEELSTWVVTTESMRFFDADDVATTDTTLVDDETASFSIEMAGADDEIIVRENDDNADAMTLELKDDAKSDWYSVFTFDIDTDDSTSDISLDDITINLLATSSVGGYNALVDDVEIIVDGTTIDDVTSVTGVTTANGTANIKFNVDGDVKVDAGDRIKVEFRVKFKSLATANEGATIVASVNGSSINGEGAEDLSGTGSDTGEIMTLRTSGLSIEQTDTTASVVNNDTNVDNSYGKFTSTVEVTAIGDTDLYVGKTATRGASSTAAVAYVIVNDAGTVITTGTSSASFDRISGGSVSGNYTKIAGNGGTATFKVNVTSFNPTVSGNYKLQILSIGFAESPAIATDSEAATPDYDFDTESAEFIQS